MTTEERIAELEEMKNEYILNETSMQIGQKSISWGELAEAQAIAEQAWNETDEGKELKALQNKRIFDVLPAMVQALLSSLKELEYLRDKTFIKDLTNGDYVDPDPVVITDLYFAIHEAMGE